MTRYYLDTSVAVHALKGSPLAEAWFDQVAESTTDELLSSRILQTELTRVLRRDRKPVLDREAVLQSVGLTPVTEAILTAAEAITRHLKTLDAIHLASALALGSDVVVVSHDANLKQVANVLGLATHDPFTVDPPGDEFGPG